jgi:hypothetical protein
LSTLLEDRENPEHLDLEAARQNITAALRLMGNASSQISRLRRKN